MKNDGAQLLHNLDLSLIQSFTPLAGQGYADLWIRKEIHESLHEYDDMIKGQVKRSRIVFLTCDLMNALSAVAENLNTFYFFRLEENSINLGVAAYQKLGFVDH